MAKLAVLGAIFVALSAGYTVLVALAAGGLGRWQGRVVGTISLALGARLALQQR